MKLALDWLAYTQRYVLTAFLGAAFSLLLYPIWQLELRWSIVVITGIILISLCMVFVTHFSDLLTLFLFFSIPLAGFEKLYFPDGVDESHRGIVFYSGTIGIGLVDFLIAGLYLSWIYRLLVSRQQPLPRLAWIDWLILLLFFSHLLSLGGVPNLPLGISSTLYLMKHILVYFYVSRNLRSHHLTWFLAAVIFAILLETSLAILQTQFGVYPGLARDKGAFSDVLDSQYTVAGIEERIRAEGTTYDSHELGHFLVMLLPFPLVLMFTGSIPWHRRLLYGAVFVLGIVGLVATFSRSAWIGFATSLCVALFVYVAYWRERYVMPGIVALLGAMVIIAPWTLYYMIERFATAPLDLLLYRIEQYKVAIDVWLHNPLFGFGAGNYMSALEYYSDPALSALPVHNMPLWIAAETGLLGFLAFHGLLIAVLGKLWQLIRAHRWFESRLALALFCGLIASFVDGLTDPSLRGAVVYLMFWLSIALSVNMTNRLSVTITARED